MVFLPLPPPFFILKNVFGSCLRTLTVILVSKFFFLTALPVYTRAWGKRGCVVGGGWRGVEGGGSRGFCYVWWSEVNFKKQPESPNCQREIILTPGPLHQLWQLVIADCIVQQRHLSLSQTPATGLPHPSFNRWLFSYTIVSRKLSANEQVFCWCSNSSKFVTNNSDYITRLFYNWPCCLRQLK